MSEKLGLKCVAFYRLNGNDFRDSSDSGIQEEELEVPDAVSIKARLGSAHKVGLIGALVARLSLGSDSVVCVNKDIKSAVMFRFRPGCLDLDLLWTTVDRLNTSPAPYIYITYLSFSFHLQSILVEERGRGQEAFVKPEKCFWPRVKSSHKQSLNMKLVCMFGYPALHGLRLQSLVGASARIHNKFHRISCCQVLTTSCGVNCSC